MSQLYAGNGAVILNHVCQPFQTSDMFVFPNTEVVRRNPPFRGNGRCFGKYNAGPTGSTAAKVYQMPIVGKTVCAGILAHGRHDDPVPGGDRSDGYWLEK